MCLSLERLLALCFQIGLCMLLLSEADATPSFSLLTMYDFHSFTDISCAILYPHKAPCIHQVVHCAMHSIYDLPEYKSSPKMIVEFWKSYIVLFPVPPTLYIWFCPFLQASIICLPSKKKPSFVISSAACYSCSIFITTMQFHHLWV